MKVDTEPLSDLNLMVPREPSGKASNLRRRENDERILTFMRLWKKGVPAEEAANRAGMKKGSAITRMHEIRRADLKESQEPYEVVQAAYDMERVCAVPECEEAVSPRNRSGVCRGHLHAVGHCRCNACKEKKDAAA